MIPSSIRSALTRREPLLWLNEGHRPVQSALPGSKFDLRHVIAAQARLNRFAALLERLFPELQRTGGIIESSLFPVESLQHVMASGDPSCGRWFIKGDHDLPVVGSIKARGGIYEVLVHAEDLALSKGLVQPNDDTSLLASTQTRTLFAGHEVAVGSTGNLGLSIGTMAAALGFRASVHMSSDAKAWKKDRLRACGVQVIEHDGDYGSAVAAGRAQAMARSNVYFVDDENSERLFFGYSVAAMRLKRQLSAHGIEVDAEHPLFVYLPCGVGGAPGGITFGLRHLFGDHAHCFFAEPVAAPCMLVRLASADARPVSVGDIGLDNRTEADGLAVGQASELAARMMRPLCSGVFTVRDSDLFEDLYLLERSEGMRVEPSAAAGLRGPRWLLQSEQGQRYLMEHDLQDRMQEATHILWTTGGALVPEIEYQRFHERGRQASLMRAVAWH